MARTPEEYLRRAQDDPDGAPTNGFITALINFQNDTIKKAIRKVDAKVDDLDSRVQKIESKQFILADINRLIAANTFFYLDAFVLVSKADVQEDTLRTLLFELGLIRSLRNPIKPLMKPDQPGEWIVWRVETDHRDRPLWLKKARDLREQYGLRLDDALTPAGRKERSRLQGQWKDIKERQGIPCWRFGAELWFRPRAGSPPQPFRGNANSENGSAGSAGDPDDMDIGGTPPREGDHPGSTVGMPRTAATAPSFAAVAAASNQQKSASTSPRSAPPPPPPPAAAEARPAPARPSAQATPPPPPPLPRDQQQQQQQRATGAQRNKNKDPPEVQLSAGKVKGAKALRADVAYGMTYSAPRDRPDQDRLLPYPSRDPRPSGRKAVTDAEGWTTLAGNGTSNGSNRDRSGGAGGSGGAAGGSGSHPQEQSQAGNSGRSSTWEGRDLGRDQEGAETNRYRHLESLTGEPMQQDA